METNDVYAGCQINLDKGEANPSGRFIDDIRSACSQLDISFESVSRCYFDGTSECYFHYRGVDWVPGSCKEQVTQNNTYKYSITAFPRYSFEYINEVSEDTRAFASSIGIQPTEEFENIKLIAPLKNKFAVELINEYRSHFFQDAYKQQDMSKSLLLYMCGENLLSLTFGKWVNNVALSLESTGIQLSSSFVNFYNDQPTNELVCYRRASHWHCSDYIQKLFGRSFEIYGSSAFIFLGRYSAKFNGSSEFDSDKTYMCVRTEEELGEMGGFSSTFAEIKYVGK